MGGDERYPQEQERDVPEGCMTYTEAKDFLARHEEYFKFSKTAVKNPHWYLVRDKAEYDSEFEKFVNTIRVMGYDEMFWKKPYRILDVEGHKYWTMGAQSVITIILNRKPIPYEPIEWAVNPIPFKINKCPQAEWDRCIGVRGRNP